jgi:hypothetical protein
MSRQQEGPPVAPSSFSAQAQIPWPQMFSLLPFHSTSKGFGIRRRTFSRVSASASVRIGSSSGHLAHAKRKSCQTITPAASQTA